MRMTLIAASAFAAALPACGQERDPLAPLPEGAARAAEAVPAIPATPSGALSWEAYKRHLAARSLAEGVSRRTVDAVLPGLEINRRSIELDRAQPGGAPGSTVIPPYAPYQRRHVTRDIIERGKAEVRQHWDTLWRLQEQYGVDKDILVAIYGKETSYGRITGNFDLFEALGTLAWEGRRRELFEGEFVAAMKLMDKGYTRDHLTGSWAGAAGKTQFMPSNILSLARDGDGDGWADIWGSEPDAYASIANYLATKGWERGIDWGIAVEVPASLDREAIRRLTPPERCPAVFNRHSRWKTMAEWRALGVTPVTTSFSDGVMLKLFEPDGPGNTAYLLTRNYDAILDYNCSNFYALTIGLVADAIER
ncbi:lytic murein transglycosylase [Sphingomicrobium astaxanthinifaciens]|uniref:lytic murein transglycosylase n=1 Tax=Sphingomicrobium astaxanthinifaciens TaxID=1227949 RepID=UPI001FCA87E4|nr:lytic murein transglycosylase [Sphingomicrobium astaxanthinifaciens]MCJ7422404.1 lytic murein transglycosylase [Sphingomicrobium astaxanthinifaciens]